MTVRGHLGCAHEELEAAASHLEVAARAVTRAGAEAKVVVRGFQNREGLDYHSSFPSADDITLEQLVKLAMSYGKMASEIRDWAIAMGIRT